MHLPVMKDEALSLIDVAEGKWYVDCTIGLGGHSQAILEKGGCVIGIDQDIEALEMAMENLYLWKERVIFKRGNFRDVKEILDSMGISSVSGFLYDLGLSSHQIDSPERGFSFMNDAFLDMRMDKRNPIKAKDIINRSKEKELYRIIKEYGEEPRARKIAKAIVSNRPIKTTQELSSLIMKAYYGKRGKIHPSTRTFQAIRIAVNDELNALKESLDQILPFLSKNGRVCVISFHSLEDRIVKEAFKKWKEEGIFNILTKKPIRPSFEEIRRNPRARSAKLRGGEKIAECRFQNAK
ncbi:MAG: 16S rRNA (cytosine(1402)-N(4))-methyltransferase RsmH [bacterium]